VQPKTCSIRFQQQTRTIGYLELSYAKQAAVPVALIQNQAGEFILTQPGEVALLQSTLCRIA